MKRPSFQFYPSDWRKDMALQSCSVAARGLWIDMMCIAHECEPYGHLRINGKPMNDDQIARHTGLSKKECSLLINELENAGVFSRMEDGCIYSRRMVKDERLRDVRAASGRLGGNPNLLKQKVNQDAKQVTTPSSSSSSSSSSSISTPDGVEGATSAPTSRRPGRKKSEEMTLLEAIAAKKAMGSKLIADNDPIMGWAEEVGLPDGYLHIGWVWFKRKYTVDDAGAKYKDWAAHFRKVMRDNWGKLWAIDQMGSYYLTTVGKQVEMGMSA